MRWASLKLSYENITLFAWPYVAPFHAGSVIGSFPLLWMVVPAAVCILEQIFKINAIYQQARWLSGWIL